jgi:uncharacterized integral membrane protein
MRWLQLAVIVLLVAVIAIFAVQNFESVSVSFISFKITVPMAILVTVIYLLGMATGSSLWSLILWGWEGSKQVGTNWQTKT